MTNLLRLTVNQIEESDEEFWIRFQPKGTAKIFSVSSHGRIFYQGQQVEYFWARDGFKYFNDLQHCVHIVCLEAFRGPKPKPLDDNHLCVPRHLDGNYRNNHISNLQWVQIER